MCKIEIIEDDKIFAKDMEDGQMARILSGGFEGELVMKVGGALINLKTWGIHGYDNYKVMVLPKAVIRVYPNGVE